MKTDDDLLCDKFDASLPFWHVREKSDNNSNSVAKVQKGVAYNRKDVPVRSVVVSIRMGKDPDGVRFTLNGVPYGALGCVIHPRDTGPEIYQRALPKVDGEEADATDALAAADKFFSSGDGKTPTVSDPLLDDPAEMAQAPAPIKPRAAARKRAAAKSRVRATKR